MFDLFDFESVPKDWVCTDREYTDPPDEDEDYEEEGLFI